MSGDGCTTLPFVLANFETAMQLWVITPVLGISYAIRKDMYALFGLLLMLVVLACILFYIHKRCM